MVEDETNALTARGQPSANIRKKDITAFYVAERQYVSIIGLNTIAEHVKAGGATKKSNSYLRYYSIYTFDELIDS